MKNIIGCLLLACLVVMHHHSYAQAGSLDLSFGNMGMASTAMSASGHSYGTATAIQADGKIVAAGYTYFGNNIDFAVSRYNTDGSLDLSFDGDGKVTTDLGDDYDFCYAVAIQADGKIVLVGGTNNYGSLAVVRYNANGSLDNTFDTDGKLTLTSLGAPMQGYDLAIQTDGKLVIAAQRFGGANLDYCVIRLNTNGSYDVSFDADGIVTTNILGDDYATEIAIQADGKIVVAGSSATDFSVVRYNTNGSLDNTFDGDGKVITSVSIGNDGISGMAIQADGKIVVVGITNVAGNVHALVRYNTNGSLDNSFDADGIVLTSNVCIVNDLQVQADGKIVAVGTYAVGPSMDFVVVRYNSNGALDLLFDTDGYVTTDYGVGKDDFAYAVAIQNDGKIVVVGNGYNTSYNNFLVARYNPGIGTSVNNLVETAYTLYPNPTQGVFCIDNVMPGSRISIINTKGQLIYTGTCNENKLVLDVSCFSRGMYVLMMENKTSRYTTQFLKE